MQVANTLALIIGQHSTQFWVTVAGTVSAQRPAVLRDLGLDPADAPAILIAAVDGLLQAQALRDAAFHRIAESGGPTTIRGRHRAALKVWESASDRVVALTRILGIARRPRPVDPLAAVHEAIRQANEAEPGGGPTS
jgi:hypothetical protein